MSETNKKENGKSGIIGLIIIGVVIVGIALLIIFSGENDSKKAKYDDPIRADVQVVGPGESMTIPMNEVTDVAHYYPVTADGVQMEIIAIRDSKGNVRTAFNTCQACYNSGKGYYLPQGKKIVCQNCGYTYTADDLEKKAENDNACIPYPIFKDNKTVTDDTISISYDFLKEAESIFANWKN